MKLKKQNIVTSYGLDYCQVFVDGIDLGFKEFEIKNDLLHVKGEDSYFTGSVISYWFNNVVRFTGTIINGLIEGEGSFFYGKGAFMEKINFINGKEDGEVISYNSDGTLETRCFYCNGSLEGVMIDYDYGYFEGIKHYKNDELHGPYILYYEDESIRSIINFKNGKIHGESLYFSISGELIKRKLFDNDVLIQEEYFKDLEE